MADAASSGLRIAAKTEPRFTLIFGADRKEDIRNTTGNENAHAAAKPNGPMNAPTVNVTAKIIKAKVVLVRTVA